MKKKLRIGIIDLVSKGPTKALWARVMYPNLASIMPQVLGVWCEEEGHDVAFVCYTGFEDLIDELPKDTDLVFIGTFTQSAQLAYALSNLLRSKGILTAIGGPHARCYPQDAQKYFDYVLGFTDKEMIQQVLNDLSPHRPMGRYLSAQIQPKNLPGVKERWKFIEPTLKKAPWIKMVPMIASLGCPYTCSFCIDSVVPYQQLEFDIIKEDLQFLLKKFKRPLVGWHDPNFGIRFDSCMDAIEEVVPPDSIDFAAESSLSILSEKHMKRLKKNGFKALLPGIESWYDLGNKSKTGSNKGLDKVMQVSEHINMIMSYAPYMQANFVMGLDSDDGAEPFELTKKFIDLSPGAFPGYSLLSAFGEAAPLNLQLQREKRVLGFPFHFLDNSSAMNVKTKNYSYPEFYKLFVDLLRHSFSKKAIARRFQVNKFSIPGWLNVVRAISSEGLGRVKYFTDIHHRLETDRQFRMFFEQETDVIPPFYVNKIKEELGPLWEWLPEGAIYHDHNAYLNSTEQQVLTA
ncbi:MAG: radical SAM protein [Bacteroidetes bacterium]|nr:radical SAM protein [Bacteroidota bacterium]